MLRNIKQYQDLHFELIHKLALQLDLLNFIPKKWKCCKYGLNYSS